MCCYKEVKNKVVRIKFKNDRKDIMKKNGIEFKEINGNKSPMRIIMKNIDTSTYKYHIGWCEIHDYISDTHKYDTLWQIPHDGDENIDCIDVLKKGNYYYPIFFEACLFLKNPKYISKASDNFDNDDLKIAFFNGIQNIILYSQKTKKL